MQVPRPFAKLPDLDAPRLRLRKLKPEDADDMFEYASNAEVARFVVWSPHTSKADSLDFILLVASEYSSPDPKSWTWAIELKAEKKVIGTINIFKSPAHNAGEIGYAIGKPYWGKGLVSEATAAVLRLGFRRLGLNRMEARCEPANIGSARVMEKNGMSYEGTIREQMFVKDRYVDLKLYSILKREYDAAQDQNSTG